MANSSRTLRSERYRSVKETLPDLSPALRLAPHRSPTFLFVLFLSSFSFVHNRVAAQTDPAPPAPTATSAPGDVYINESFEAADTLAKARTFVAQNRWREAAELLQKAADEMSDRVVKTPDGYTGLRGYVTRMICDWPEEGIRTYRSLFEPVLQRELRELGDTPSLDSAVALFDQYFCTEGAAAMADGIAQVAIESGDLTLAQWVLRRVLNQHPAGRAHATRYESLLVLILAMQGEPTGEITARLGDTRLRWKGRDTTLSDAVGEISTEFSAPSSSAGPDEWPFFAGNLQRNRDAQTSVDEPGLLWRYQVRPPVNEPRTDGIIDGLVRAGSETARALTIFPVVAGDLVYIQSHRDIAAVHRNSGAVAWVLRSDDGDPEPTSYIDDVPLGGESPAVDEGRVFVALPTHDSTFYDYETARTVHELVGIDALTGTILWRNTQKNVDAQGTATAYDSAPLTRSGRVYIVSRKRRSFGFEDCYLDCYRAADGRLLFRTHLGSASTSALGLRGATKSIAALHGDSVYVCTNLGTIASISAYSGGIQWLRLYERFRPDPSGAGWPVRDGRIVPFNPLIYSDDRLIALPTDSPKLFVFRASDGGIIKDIPASKLADIHTIVGIHGDTICGIGDQAFCQNLNKDEPDWSARISEENPVVGRSIWAGADLFVPLRDGLSRLRASDGQGAVLALGPHYKGGNVLTMPEQILVAGSDEVLCFVRKAEIWKSIRQRMAAAPNDPLPALEFAEVALGAGEIDNALAALAEAVSRVQPSLTTASMSIRARVLSDSLRTLDELPDKNSPAVDVLFRYAAEAAGDSTSQIEFRLRFAEFFQKAGRPARAVRLYQQILRDRTLRDWPPAQSDTPLTRAGVRVAARIDELIRANGPEVYAEFEAEAAQWLEAARNSGDEAGLLAVQETFPNSTAASQALLTHAEMLGKSGKHEAAARAWERAYNQFSDSTRRPEFIARIAECYERGGKEELAWLWLAKAAREYPADVVNSSGRTTTFAEWRDRLSSARARVEPPRPRVTLPLTPGFEHALVGPVQLLVPRFADAPGTDWKQVYVLNPDGIRGYHSDSGKGLWTQPAPVRMIPELLTSRADLAVFATPFEVFAIDVSTGLRRYSHGEYPARLADPGADWEDGTSFRTHALHGDRLVSVREDGAATCRDVRNGDVLWSVTRRPAPLGVVALSDSILAYHVSREGRALVNIASADTGELLETVLTDETRPVDDLHITIDGQLVMVTSKTIACYDVSRQERRWQVSLNWPIRRPTLEFDMDSVYFIDDAGVLKKIGLSDGRTIWESERVVLRSEENETLRREGEYLIVSTRSSVSAVDLANGLLLWQGTTPESPRFLERAITSCYVAAMHVPSDAAKGAAEVYFYDHRNASGVIPRVGGVVELGPLAEVRNMIVADGSVFVLDGTTVRGYFHKSN